MAKSLLRLFCYSNHIQLCPHTLHLLCKVVDLTLTIVAFGLLVEMTLSLGVLFMYFFKKF